MLRKNENNNISCLKNTLPEWVTLVAARNDNEIIIKVSPKHKSGTPIGTFNLRIKAIAGKVTVSETVPGTTLPVRCPERHINGDSTFCIGLDAGKDIQTNKGGEVWWIKLLEHLRCQHFASKKGFWPPDKGLAHGDAAYTQLQMEQIAERIGCKNDVKNAVEKGTGWIVTGKINPNTNLLYNQRSQCPRGCKYRHYPRTKFGCDKNPCSRSCAKQHKVILKADCPHADKIRELVFLESKRQKQEKEFWREYKKRYKSNACCKTMKNCPLKKTKRMSN